jgi:hypothetical protein
MASPDVLDDMWKQGLAELTRATEPVRDASARVHARVARRQTRRTVGQVTAVAALVVATSVAIVVSVRGDDGAAPPADEPHVTTTTAPQQHVDADFYRGNLATTVDYVAPGPVDLKFVNFGGSYGGTTPMLQLPDGTRLRPGDHATIEVPPRGFLLKAIVDNRTAGETKLLLGIVYHRPTRPPDATIDVTALQSLQMQPHHLRVRAGVIRIRYHDASPGGTHTLAIDGMVGMPGLEVSSAGDVKSIDLELAPGVYKLYCQIPGHRAAGMQATLVVTPH